MTVSETTVTPDAPPTSSRLPSMGGRTIALLESRRAAELASLVTSYGGVPFHAPVLREEPVDDLESISAFLDAIAADPIDVMIFQTGVGARALFRGVDSLGRADELRGALDRVLVAVRGPKPVAALREVGVRVDVRAAEPFTTPELLAALADVDLTSKRVAVQHYGEPNVELVAALRGRGAVVLDVEVYRWTLPDELAPIENLLHELLAARVDALVVTSQVQVRHLYEIAARHGLAAALPDLLHGRVTVVAVGPIAAAALRERGIGVDIAPEHPKMGPMVRDLATYFESRVPRRERCPE